MKRWLFVALVAGWVLIGMVGALGVASLLFLDDTLCEHETGDSDFGDASWSWLPLGTECEWTEPPNLVTDHEDPSWGPTVFTVLYLGAGVALARGARTRRGGRRGEPLPQFTDR